MRRRVNHQLVINIYQKGLDCEVTEKTGWIDKVMDIEEYTGKYGWEIESRKLTQEAIEKIKARQAERPE